MDKIKDRAILLFCPSSLLDDREEHSARGPAVSLNAGSLAISPALPRRRFARRLPNAAARDHRRRNPLHNALPGRRVALSSPTFPVKAALEPEIKRSFSIQSSSFLVSKQHVLPGPRLLTRHPLLAAAASPTSGSLCAMLPDSCLPHRPQLGVGCRQIGVRRRRTGGMNGSGAWEEETVASESGRDEDEAAPWRC
ncbi:hypothetical protein OsJ_21014 [Oryza sativa Japonica Group]|uniref:Uncharacterized protein n=1 Tax=Oryza sativa subsp. japonica TaxID=39947 RepID=B9FST3_ORYSJ|nr:hypothetical protein OsJ_21014 [Oryza sativa Japonica Group]